MNNIQTTKFSKISNILFLLVSIFCLSFLWCNFYLKNFRISLYGSLLITISFCILFFPLYNINQKKKKLSKEDKLKIEKLKYNLLYNSELEILNTLKQVINLQDFINISNSHFYSKKLDKDIFFLFYEDNIFATKLAEIYKSRISNNIQIYCINKPNFNNIIENITIEFTEIYKIYELFNKNSIIFDTNINIINKPKISAKDVLCIVLSKGKSKSYFWIGILLIFSSLFTPYSIYYIVASSILILLSIFCRFNTIFN